MLSRGSLSFPSLEPKCDDGDIDDDDDDGRDDDDKSVIRVQSAKP